MKSKYETMLHTCTLHTEPEIIEGSDTLLGTWGYEWLFPFLLVSSDFLVWNVLTSVIGKIHLKKGTKASKIEYLEIISPQK